MKREKEIQKMKMKMEEESKRSEIIPNEIKKVKELTKSIPLSINEIISSQQESFINKQSSTSPTSSANIKDNKTNNKLTIQSVLQINNLPSSNSIQFTNTEEIQQQQQQQQNQSDLFLKPSKCPIILPTYYVYKYISFIIYIAWSNKNKSKFHFRLSS